VKRASDKATIFEVFSGIQGEGPLVGERQIFLRFCNCNLRCRYCDTRAARRPVRQAQLELAPGSRRFERAANPIGLERVLDAVERLDDPPGLHHSVSLTGGEPLLHAGFLARLLPALHKIGLRNYLETNGTLPAALAEIVKSVDIVAMDIKLASATGQRDRFAAHRRFLEIASKRECIVKAVVTAATSECELQTVGRLVREASPDAIVVLQPVTPGVKGVRPPTSSQALGFQRVVKQFVPHVRVIPQVHKLMGQM
jgi:organic radical activating enzyme